MFDSLLDVLGTVIQILRNNPKARAWITILALILLSGAIAAWASIPFVFGATFVAEQVAEVARAVALGSGFLTFICLASYSNIKIEGGGLSRIELKTLRDERQTIQERLQDKPKADILDTIQLNLNQLSEYYVINKSQARNSFRFSVFAVVAGLGTLLAGIWFFYLRSPPNLEMSVVSGVAGVLVQFIGGAYFYLYRTSLNQLNFFFAQLVKMQDTMLSVKLCEQIAPEDRQAALREKIILTLLERSSSALALDRAGPALSTNPGL